MFPRPLLPDGSKRLDVDVNVNGELQLSFKADGGDQLVLLPLNIAQWIYANYHSYVDGAYADTEKLDDISYIDKVNSFLEFIFNNSMNLTPDSTKIDL